MTRGTVTCLRHGSSSLTAECTSSTSKLNWQREDSGLMWRKCVFILGVAQQSRKRW